MTRRIVVVNPPLRVPEPFIDNPAFSFLAPHRFSSAGPFRGQQVSFLDAFLGAEPRLSDGIYELGPTVEHFAGQVNEIEKEVLVLAYPSYHRASAVASDSFAAFVRDLDLTAVEVHVVDFYDTSTHYIDYSEAQVDRLFPVTVRLHRRSALPFGVSVDHVLGSLSLSDDESFAEYLSFVNHPVNREMLKDCREGSLVFPLLASLGCQYRCRFCSANPFQWQPVAGVNEALSFLSRSGVGTVVFLDQYANYDVDRFKQILRTAVSLGLTTHFANGLGLRHIDAETAKLLSQCTDFVFISPESGSDAVLKMIKKPFTVEHSEEAVRLLSAAGVAVRAHFMIGAPGETLDDTKETLDLARRWRQQHGVEPFVQRYVPQSELAWSQESGNVYEKFEPTSHPDTQVKAAFRAFEHAVQAPSHRKLIVNLSYRCNNRCRFCSVADRARIDGDLGNQRRQIDQAAEQGITLLDLDGGEPFLYPHLFDVIDHAIAQGFERISITTNGRMLRYESLVEKLARFEQVSILISLHSLDSSVQDDLTRAPGSFDDTITGIRNAAKHFDDLGVNVTLTAHNHAGLPDFVPLLRELGIRILNIQYYTPFGDVDPSLAPPPEAIDSVRETVASSGEAPTIRLIGFTPCMAPDLEHLMAGDFFKEARDMVFVGDERVNLAEFLGQRRKRDQRCAECEYDRVCRGHWVYTSDKAGARRVQMIDIMMGYQCNSKCRFCSITDEIRNQNMDARTIARKLDEGIRMYGPSKIRFGGGEPTIRKSLAKLIGFAAKQGIETVSIQTNGYKLAEEEFLDNLLASGMNKVNISIRAHDEELYSQLTGIPAAFARVNKAIENLVTRSVPLELDVLLTKPMISQLSDLTRYYSEKGVTDLNYWYVAIEGQAAARIDELIPTMTATARYLGPVFDEFPELELKAFYLPYCFFPRHPDKVWHPVSENALVISPSLTFMLEAGEVDIGVLTESCVGCLMESTCFGVRQSYIDHFGIEEIRPLGVEGRG